MDYHLVAKPLNDEPFISNRFGDRFLYSINRHSFDRVGSDAVYHSRWGDAFFKENSFYIIAGCDSGVLITYLQKKGVPKGSRYLFVELSSLSDLFQTFINEPDVKNSIQVCTIDNWLQVARENFFAEYAYLDSVKIIRSLAVEDANFSEYRALWRVLDQSVQQILWSFRVEQGNSTFYTRQIENICENRQSAHCLKDLFTEKTAVLLAGGPSLDDAMPWVVKNRDNLVVVAVSRICRRLQQLNFKPDIIVTVDPHPCSFDVSKHMLRLYEHSILVTAFHSTPLLLGQWPGPSLYMDNRYPWTADKAGKIVKGVGPTVSNSAINLILAMGCRQIILAGLDLCFSEEGYSHAKGSDERKAGAFLAYADQTVTTNNGNTAETDNAFFTAIKSIEAQARSALDKGCQLINPSPRAAKMQNVAYLPLEKIHIDCLEQPAMNSIRRALPKEDSETRLAAYQHASKQFDKAEYAFKKIKQLSNNALAHNDGLFGRNGKKADFKHKLQMDKIEKQLNKELSEFASLCKLFGMKEFIKTFSTTDAENWSDEEIESKGRIYYQAYISGADSLLDLISTGKKRILSRIEEEKQSPDFELLFSQWQLDSQPGRAKIWQINHKNSLQTLPDNITAAFNKFISDLECEIDNADHAHVQKIKEYASLQGVTGKALEFFKNHDTDGLMRLLKGLATRKDTETQILQNLISGYYAEINGQTQSAVENYQFVVINEPNAANPALENALSRLTFLALEQHDLDTASSYLEALSGLSPAYMPQYADILRITNNLQRSIDIYTEYLNLAPDDLSTMMKLALLYKHIGVKEGAQLLFSHILTKDPNNSAAQELLKQVKLSA